MLVWFLLVLSSAPAVLPQPVDDLVVYYCWDDQTAQVLLDAFAAESGVTMKGMRRSSRHLVKVIEAERDHTVASVIMSCSTPSFEMLKSQNLLQTYKPQGAEKIRPAWRDDDHTWTGLYVGVIAFGTDSRQTDLVPESYDDLLQMDLPRGLAYANPATSGTSYSFLMGLIAVQGEAGAFDFLARLHPRVVEVPSGGAMAVRLLEMGEVTTAVAFYHDIIRMRSASVPLVVSFPAEGTGWEVGAVALLRDAPNPEAGKRFIDFLFRPKIQEMIWRQGGVPAYPTHPAAQTSPELPPLEGIARVKLSFRAAGRQWDQRALRWNRQFPRSR